jgi:hypothetical protein
MDLRLNRALFTPSVTQRSGQDMANKNVMAVKVAATQYNKNHKAGDSFTVNNRKVDAVSVQKVASTGNTVALNKVLFGA